MPSPDPATLFMVLSAVGIFVAVLVMVVWRGDRRYEGMREVALGLAVMATGFITQALSAAAPSAGWARFFIAAGHLQVLIGGTLNLNGAVTLAGAGPAWRRDWIIGAASYAVYLWLIVAYPASPLRHATVSGWSVLICGGAALALAAQHGDASRGSRRMLAALLTLHAATEGARGIDALLSAPPVEFRPNNALNILFLFEFIFAILGIAILSMQFVNERLQRDLRRSEARIVSAFRVASDAFAVFDGAGRLVTANPRVARIFPPLVALLAGRPAVETMFGAVPAAFGLGPGWLARGAGGFSLDREVEHVAQLDGGAWVHASAAPIDGGGLILCWRDITEFKQAEAVLAGELARQRELAAMQRSFVSMASHQFRTPLAIIDINAQLIELHRQDRGGEATELSGRIRRTVRRMIRLIEAMLGAASAEEGKIALKKAPADLGALVREACERAQEAAPDRLFDLDLAGLPPMIDCDANLIDQVLGNLVSNAVKYSGADQPVIVSGRIEAGCAVVAVTDFGVGIPAEDQPLIFERFFRGRNTADIAGTGIGLTLARYIVELHGGTIAVDSALGAGSTFTVTLPAG